MGNIFFIRGRLKRTLILLGRTFFSELFKKHTRTDMEYALSADTWMNSATEADMLQKWQKPWLWTRALGGGVALSLLLYVLILILTALEPRDSYSIKMDSRRFTFAAAAGDRKTWHITSEL